MDNKTLILQTITDFHVTNYQTLWANYIRQLPKITARDLDDIIRLLAKQRKIKLMNQETVECWSLC